jgi:predicted phage terminase large subunit-like protein
MMADQGGPDAYWWLALYQQTPTPLGGGILKPEQFRKFSVVEDGYLLDTPAGPRMVSTTALRKFGTMDLATSVRTQADYTVLGVFGLTGPDLMVLDVFRNRWEGPDLPRVAARVWEAYGLAYIGVESVGFQQSTIQDMRRGRPDEKRKPLPIKALPPQGDKVTRALTLAARMGGGHVYVPHSAPWLATLEAEMATFPKGKHDDQVDVLAYAALEQTAFGDDFMRAE